MCNNRLEEMNIAEGVEQGITLAFSRASLANLPDAIVDLQMLKSIRSITQDFYNKCKVHFHAFVMALDRGPM